MILCNRQLIINRMVINISVSINVTNPDQKRRFVYYNVESSIKSVELAR